MKKPGLGGTPALTVSAVSTGSSTYLRSGDIWVLSAVLLGSSSPKSASLAFSTKPLSSSPFLSGGLTLSYPDGGASS
jgi:hypothetical protein